MATALLEDAFSKVLVVGGVAAVVLLVLRLVLAFAHRRASRRTDAILKSSSSTVGSDAGR